MVVVLIKKRKRKRNDGGVDEELMMRMVVYGKWVFDLFIEFTFSIDCWLVLVDRWGFQFLIQIDGDDDGIKFFFIEDSIKIRKFLLMF